MSGENETGGAPETARLPMDKSVFLAMLGSLSPAEKARLLPPPRVVVQVAPQAAQGTPKFSEALKHVTDRTRAMSLLGACDRAQGPDALARAFDAFASEFPEAASAALTNSTYRNKPLAHSVGVAIRWLNAQG